jgi:hypothetical protein
MRSLVTAVVVTLALPATAAAHLGRGSWPSARANRLAATFVPRALNPLTHARARCAGYDRRGREPSFRHFTCILQSRNGSPASTTA